MPCLTCRVRISALALLKMAMHAKSGGNIEVMGVMQVGGLGRCRQGLRSGVVAGGGQAAAAGAAGFLRAFATCCGTCQHLTLPSLQGKIQGSEFIVIDTFALPVEGTETRVNAQAEAYEYMVDFLETAKVRKIKGP
jgi:COP9 signalosome complex subunit 5